MRLFSNFKLDWLVLGTRVDGKKECYDNCNDDYLKDEFRGNKFMYFVEKAG